MRVQPLRAWLSLAFLASCVSSLRTGLHLLSRPRNAANALWMSKSLGVEEEGPVLSGGNKGGRLGFRGTLSKAGRIMYKFSRPHTIKGTVLASTVGVTRALVENPQAISLKLVPRALIGLLAILAGNAYIVGINKIYDVKVDEIN